VPSGGSERWPQDQAADAGVKENIRVTLPVGPERSTLSLEIG
jgi:hypothetical protein